MNKKMIIGIVVGIVGLAAIGVAATMILTSRNNKESSESGNTAQISNNTGENTQVSGKVLVAYYSAQNHTKNVAEKIARNLGADTFEIIPQEVYTAEDLDWTADDSRVNREHNDESLRDIALVSTDVPNWEDYDTILIGYPIWWGIAAWPVDNFVKDNDFSDKIVIPFCTSTSSGLGQSGELLKQMANGGNWQIGHRFSSSATDAEIKTWTDSL